MNKKSLLVLFVVLLLIAGTFITSCAPKPAPAPAPAPAPTAAPAHPVKWRASAGVAADDPVGGVPLVAITNLLRERTKGRVDITPYFGAVLGSWDATNEMVMRGDIDMQFDAIDDSFDPRLAIAYYMPYLLTSYAEAKKLWPRDGYVFQTLLDIAKPLGYMPVGCPFPGGISGLTLKNRPPSPGDPNVKKNMKIRVMALTACRLTYDRLGYMSVPIPYGEVYTSIQTSIVDGQMGGGTVQACRFKDVQKYYIQYGDFIEPYWAMVNVKAFNSLSPEDQKIFGDVVDEVGLKGLVAAEEQDKKYMQVFRDYGNEVILLTPEEVAKCAAAVREDVWPQLVPLIGKAVLSKLCDAVGIGYPWK